MVSDTKTTTSQIISDAEPKTRKVGILGGTFDPIHYGHIFLAEAARDRFDLDLVYFMPTDDPYYKPASKITSFDDRFQMTCLALEGKDRLLPSDFERVNDTDGFTVNSLTIYKAQFPSDELFFIVGGDSLFTMENWKEIEKIFSMTVILVNKRKDETKGASGSLAVSSVLSEETAQSSEETDELDLQIAYLKEKYGARIYNIHAPQFDVSSSQLRASIREGENVDDYLPASVIRYIKDKNLYKGS